MAKTLTRRDALRRHRRVTAIGKDPITNESVGPIYLPSKLKKSCFIFVFLTFWVFWGWFFFF